MFVCPISMIRSALIETNFVTFLSSSFLILSSDDFDKEQSTWIQSNIELALNVMLHCLYICPDRLLLIHTKPTQIFFKISLNNNNWQLMDF